MRLSARGRTAVARWVMAATATALFSAASLTAAPARADDGWSGDPVASSAAGTQDCAQVLFVGARGSGQEAPYGDMVDGVRTELATRVGQQRSDLRLAQVYLDYPAVSLDDLDTTSVENMVLGEDSSAAPSYVTSVDAGTSELERLARAEAQRCPDEKLLAVGYSQGAEVVTRALNSGALGDNLLGAVLLGNPLHYNGQNVTELDGTASNRSYGLTAALYYLKSELAQDTDNREAQVGKLVETAVKLYNGTVDSTAFASAMSDAGASVPGETAPRTWSVCTADDPVCDSANALSSILSSSATLQSAREAGSRNHGTYTPDNLQNTLAAVTSKLTELPHAPEPSSEQPSGHSRAALFGAIGAAVVLVGGGTAVFWRRHRAAV